MLFWLVFLNVNQAGRIQVSEIILGEVDASWVVLVLLEDKELLLDMGVLHGGDLLDEVWKGNKIHFVHVFQLLLAQLAAFGGYHSDGDVVSDGVDEAVFLHKDERIIKLVVVMRKGRSKGISKQNGSNFTVEVLTGILA